MALRAADAGLLALHVLLSAGGLILIKSNAPGLRLAWQRAEIVSAPTMLLALGVGFYVAGFAIWVLVLARNELSVVYPIAVGATLAASSLAAALLFGEVLGAVRLAGIACILLGVALVVRS